MICDRPLRLLINQNLPQLRFNPLEWFRSTCVNASAVNGLGARAGEAMTVKEYVLKRLNQGETDLHVLARQTRIQFPSFGISFSYIKRIRNEWRKASALQEEASV